MKDVKKAISLGFSLASPYSPPHCVLSLLVCKPSLTYFCGRNFFPQNIRKFFKASELPRSSLEVGRNLVKSMLDINSFIRPFILERPVLDKSSNEDTDLQMRPMSWWIAKSDLSGECPRGIKSTLISPFILFLSTCHPIPQSLQHDLHKNDFNSVSFIGHHYSLQYGVLMAFFPIAFAADFQLWTFLHCRRGRRTKQWPVNDFEWMNVMRLINLDGARHCQDILTLSPFWKYLWLEYFNINVF